MAETVQNENGDSGILQPVLKHRWFLDTTLPDELNQLLRSQAVKCSINIVKRTFHLEIEQPISYGNKMFYIMELLAKGRTGISIQTASGGHEEQAYDMVGISARLVDHKYEQDYADAEVAMHVLDFEF